MTTLQVTRQSEGEIIVNVMLMLLLIVFIVLVGYMHQHRNENIWMKVDQFFQCHIYHQSVETKCPI